MLYTVILLICNASIVISDCAPNNATHAHTLPSRSHGLAACQREGMIAGINAIKPYKNHYIKIVCSGR